MSANALQLETRARRILCDLRKNLPASHIEGWLKVKRLSDYLRANHKGATITKWRESPHSVLTYTPVSDELEELQVQRTSLAKLVDEAQDTYMRSFYLITRNNNGAAVYDKQHGLVYFLFFKSGEAPHVTVAPYDAVKADLGSCGVRLQHVRTNVPAFKHLLKVY